MKRRVPRFTGLILLFALAAAMGWTGTAFISSAHDVEGPPGAQGPRIASTPDAKSLQRALRVSAQQGVKDLIKMLAAAQHESSPARLQALIDAVRRSDADDHLRRAAFAVLRHRLQQIDPTAAANLPARLETKPPPNDDPDGFRKAAADLVRNADTGNFRAAWDGIKTAQSQNEFAGCVIAEAMRTDPAGAVKWLQHLPESARGKAVRLALNDEHLTTSEVIAFVSALPEPLRRFAASAYNSDSDAVRDDTLLRMGVPPTSEAAERLTSLASRDVPAALAWYHALPVPAQHSLLPAMVENLGAHQPQDAVRLIETSPRGHRWHLAALALAQQWSQWQPDAAREWLRLLPPVTRAAAEKVIWK